MQRLHRHTVGTAARARSGCTTAARAAARASSNRGRRRLIGGCLVGGAACSFDHPASAALVQFPAEELNNTYLLLRAGESVADAEGIINTNPVNKQSRFAELTPLGQRQIVNRVTPALQAILKDNPAWIWSSISSCAYQTASVLASTLGLGQSRLVPEYSFLEPRGLGAWDGKPLADVGPLVYEGDASSPLWKPPRGYDGTPNESVADVIVRTRQVLSIVETSYDDELIIVVAPDSSVLSIMQAALLGVDLRDHWGLAFRPAELRTVQLSEAAARNDGPSMTSCPNPPSCT